VCFTAERDVPPSRPAFGRSVSPGKRAFTPVFDGLWGETTKAERLAYVITPSIYATPGQSGLLALRMIPEGLPIRRWPPFHRGIGRHEWTAMTERSSAGLDERRKKLLFRAWRRGVREMDLIVGRFADAHIDKFDAEGLDDFERLIEAGNSELYAWVVGTESAPAHYDTAVLAQLKAFHARTATNRAEEEH
jgi:antitoxin CptB